MAKVKLNLSRRSVENKLTLGDGIKTALTGNANFPDPDPTLVVYGGVITDLRARATAVATLKAQLKTAFTQFAAAEATFDTSTTALMDYVQKKSGGDAAKIESAGMGVRATSLPIGPLPQVENLSVTGGDDDGELDAAWDPVRGAKSYEVQVCADPITPAGWRMVASSPKSQKTLKNLTSGQRLWVRVRAIAPKEDHTGAWSDPAVKTVP
jgi:hypothetical protein